mmetsp:Transcript_21811/g.60591  ORF Transcript_21811/g.60591 Transcript_21811/m.60591 type:complete len:110 (+) Transcript_21811:824-1153(+)
MVPENDTTQKSGTSTQKSASSGTTSDQPPPPVAEIALFHRSPHTSGEDRSGRCSADSSEKRRPRVEMEWIRQDSSSKDDDHNHNHGSMRGGLRSIFARKKKLAKRRGEI